VDESIERFVATGSNAKAESNNPPDESDHDIEKRGDDGVLPGMYSIGNVLFF